MAKQKMPLRYLYRRIGWKLTVRAVVPLILAAVLFGTLFFQMRSAVLENAYRSAESRVFRLALSVDSYTQNADDATVSQNLSKLLELTEVLARGPATSGTENRFQLFILDGNGVAVAHSLPAERGKNYLDEAGSGGKTYQKLMELSDHSGYGTLLAEDGGAVYSAVKLSNGWHAVCAHEFVIPFRQTLLLWFACTLAGILFTYGAFRIMCALAIPRYVNPPERVSTPPGEWPKREKRDAARSVGTSAAAPAAPTVQHETTNQLKGTKQEEPDYPIRIVKEAPPKPEEPAKQTAASAAKASARTVETPQNPVKPIEEKEIIPEFLRPRNAKRAEPKSAEKDDVPASVAEQDAEPDGSSDGEEGSKTVKQLADNAMLASFYAQIAKAAHNMEYDQLGEAFERMDSYRMPASEVKLYADLRAAFEQLEYGVILNLLTQSGKISEE